MSPGRALIETVLDCSWDLFEKAGATPYSAVDPDGTRYTVFSGTDPPTLRMRRIARQDQAAAAHTVAA